MKILHAFDMFTPHGGGTVAVINKIARALAGKGHEVTIYASDYKLDKDYIASMPNVKVVTFPCLSKAANYYIMPAINAELKKNLKDFQAVHLHCFRSYQNMKIHKYAVQYGVPYIIDAHGSLPRTSEQAKNFKWLLKYMFDAAVGNRILRDAGKVIAETTAAVEEYKEFGVEEDRIALITPPFDIEEFSDLPEPDFFKEKYRIKEKYMVLFMGRIHWIKGLDFLVRSFKKLADKRDDVRLVIAGSDDGYRRKLEKLCRELGLADKVLFTGFISGQDRLAALADADVVTQTSVYEQGTGVTYEAVLCGTPIIVTRDTVASENVRDIDAGYLVEYGNTDELAETIQHVIDNPEEAIGKAKKAAEYIRNNLSLEKVLGQYEQVYEEVIRSS